MPERAGQDSVGVAADGCDERVVLQATGVSKCYDLGEIQVHALRGVDLSVCEGEMLSIMGPSGSGKSTLMHLVGMLDTPTEGTVVVEGEDVSHADPNRLAEMRNKRIGFVFQTFNLLSRTSATAQVELPLVYAGVGGSERTRRARETLVSVGLGDRLTHLPNQLSGGQQQRVAIARALVTEPSIVLADEPTGNLDSRSGIEVMSLLQDLNEQGITVVLVTHDDRIARHGTRIVELKDGLIVREELVAERIVAREELIVLDAEEAGA